MAKLVTKKAAVEDANRSRAAPERAARSTASDRAASMPAVIHTQDGTRSTSRGPGGTRRPRSPAGPGARSPCRRRSQLHERHDASDFDTKTQDKIGAQEPAA